jgi:hypothetical protein
MRKKTASGVLASLASQRRRSGLRGSTYGTECAFASSLAAALLDSLFAHPAGLFSVVSNLGVRNGYRGQNEFFRSLLEQRQPT